MALKSYMFRMDKANAQTFRSICTLTQLPRAIQYTSEGAPLVKSKYMNPKIHAFNLILDDTNSIEINTILNSIRSVFADTKLMPNQKSSYWVS